MCSLIEIFGDAATVSSPGIDSTQSCIIQTENQDCTKALLASSSAFSLLQWVDSRDATAVRQAHAQSLDSAGHCVGGVHATTSTCSGTSMPHNVMHLLVIYQSCCVGTCIDSSVVMIGLLLLLSVFHRSLASGFHCYCMYASYTLS